MVPHSATANTYLLRRGLILEQSCPDSVRLQATASATSSTATTTTTATASASADLIVRDQLHVIDPRAKQLVFQQTAVGETIPGVFSTVALLLR